MRTPFHAQHYTPPLFTLYSKKMMLLIGSKKPLPGEEQRPEFTFTEKLLAAAACSQTCQSQQRKRSRGGLGDSGGYH